MPDSVVPSTEDAELRAHVEQALSATYELDQEIGRGGMGIVYRAKDKRLKRFVAIKLLPPELSFRRDIRTRFLREAETAAQLSHPNIVPIYSVDEVGNLVFFVMACIDGDNLATKLQKRGPLPIDDVRRWLLEVADALAFAHARGVIHRDIKPDNILLDSIDGRALVTDFGIARAASDSGETSRLTATGMAIGTPAYMSPEQASGDRDLDARSDLYSLGIVAYQMLAGEPPFTGGTTPALLVKHLAEVPVPVSLRRPDTPDDLSQIVMRLLEKSPEHRFQSAGEMVTALKTGVVPPPTNPAATQQATGAPVRFNGAPIGGMPLGGFGSPAPSAPAAPSVPYTPAPYTPPAYQPPTYQSRTAVTPQAAPYPLYQQPASGDDVYVATAEDEARWFAPPVVAFRRKLAPYLFVNGAILVISIFTGGDMLGLTTLWTVYIAWKYAKLWADGFDWTDVLKQPKHRMLGEVLSDLGDKFMATFSRKKREELRAQGRLRNRLDGVLSSTPSSPVTLRAAVAMPNAPARDDELGEFVGLVKAARADREEIGRLLGTLPADERGRIPDVARTAVDLVNKVEIIARDISRVDREQGPDAARRIDAEIGSLEAEANPLDTQRSEGRVRRLAQLRRDRRAVADTLGKRELRRAQLESCRIALENVRLDLVRLRTGNSSVQSVTLVAEQAMQLARDVDIAVQAANEVREATSSRSGSA
ncbi:serine/threonine-protein kinase [Gemmatimonas sp.]|uniref:serine/threonine-protein kinase n=1 Tax=Gemmatimonas sp. TaxID=1962908 RepID=UPI00286D506C|nr:serine/threonine-protein kinase [Gemmatimonas sp.]